MAQPDDLIHQPLRLRIMSALWAGRDADPLEFSHLKKVTGATDGNLGSHLAALEKAGYVAVAKDFVGKRPRTRVAITPAGGRAFRGHVAWLRELVEEAEG